MNDNILVTKMRSLNELKGVVKNIGVINGMVTTGKMIVNDYLFEISETDTGYIFTATRGSEVQQMILPKGGDGSDEPGTPGKDGGYYIPTVVDGWLKWAASVAGMPEVDSTYIRGERGPAGEDGKTPEKGVDYFTHEELDTIAEEAAKKVTIDQVLPEQVYFPNGVQTTFPLGTVELQNGIAQLIPKEGTLKDFFDIFMKETNPSTTDPKVTLTFSQAKAYEVGTNVTPSFSASFDPGSYTYGPETGVTVSAWEVTDTAGHKATAASGSFAQFQVTDGISYKITAKATHSAGATPVTNTGNPYETGKIPAGSKSATSGAVTGYRNTFYGTTTDKNTLTNATVRGLTKSGKALANGNSFTVNVPVGAMRVVIAYPATLRDVNSIKDVNGLNAEIASGFTKSTMNITGENGYTAISYKVYTMEFANANDKANKFTVVI